MDVTVFKERTKRLMEVNEVIAKLDPAVRAPAFSLLEEYVVARSAKPVKPPQASEAAVESVDEGDRTTFFQKHSGNSPAEAARAVAAYHFSKFGREPMTPADVKRIADDVGIILPDRPDVTLKVAKDGSGNPLFKVGGGQIRPTVHGAKYITEKFGVSMGNQRHKSEAAD